MILMTANIKLPILSIFRAYGGTAIGPLMTARGGMIIHGRSDATLNPGGVRIGTAEIYRQVELLMRLPKRWSLVRIGKMM